MKSFLGSIWGVLANERGALTFAAVKRFKPHAGIKRGIIDITFDAVYAAGGWAITAANLGITGAGVILTLVPPAHKNGYHLEWDQVNSKLKAYQEQDTASLSKEIDAGDLDTQVARCEYVGY